MSEAAKDYRFETLQVHAGQTPAPGTNARAVPIYQTSSFVFNDSAHAARLFALEEVGNVYTRIFNPTSDVFEQRIAVLEGGIAAVAVSTPTAARFLTLVALAQAGDEILVIGPVYGVTEGLFSVTLPRLGIAVRIVADATPETLGRAIGPRTKALYVETINEHSLDVPDFAVLARLTQAAGIPLVVDNSRGAAGYLARPIEHGADIVLASASELIGGHGSTDGGIIVDSGRFNWANGNFPLFTEPSPGYHGLRFWESFGPASSFGNIAFAVRVRVDGARDIGPSLSPLSGFQFLIGVETLSLRVRRQLDNALALATWLQGDERVLEVSYPGLEDHPAHAIARKYLKDGFGTVINFTLRGGGDRVPGFIDELQLILADSSIGSVRSGIFQPDPEGHPGRLRLTVGTEHVDDLIEDLDLALPVVEN